MISRRLLRVKILQVLYADFSKHDQTISQSEKELFFSINKSYDLYYLFLLLPIELVKVDEQRLDAVSQRLIVSNDLIETSANFSTNKFVELVRKNWQLSRYVSENKVGWVKNPELIKNLYSQIREREYFIEYLQKSTTTFDEDKALILKILEEEVSVFEPLDSTLEDISIFWNDDIDFVLSMVIKTLKTFKETDGPEKTLMPLFKNEEDREFVKKLYRKVAINHDEYNTLIKDNAQNWEFERIALMDVLIMQMALAEMIEFPSIPVKVSLNEYIDISKDYSTANSNTFINGILDNVVKDLTAKKVIMKVGRGLMEK
jgi:N utilization substance protein B